MAHIRAQDFAEKLGVASRYISVYVSRGKVVREPTGLIDENHPVNVAFLKSRQGKKSGNKSKKKETKKEAPGPVVEEQISEVQPKINGHSTPTSEEALGFHELEKRLKALDIQKRAEEVEKLRKQNAKLDGETIPTELAGQIASQLSQSMVMAMKTMVDKTLLEWSKRKKFSGAEVAQLRKHMVDELNRAAEVAIKDSKKSMKVLVQKYSIKRGVGERA